jgi:hypothetical protein
MKKFQAATLTMLMTMTLAMSGAIAQPQPADEPGNAVAAASQPNAASMTKAQKKAARKAARKEVRARRNAELKKLESAGYKPGGYDPNCPENAQGAEKKAGVAPPQQ